MSTVILTNWTVYYKGDTGGDKQIRWTGAGAPETNTNTVNELYSALADLFSISTQNDAHDTTPLRAVTPTVYEIGALDQKDQEAWFIDPDSVQHLTDGSIQTVGWTRVVNADANLGTPGIVKISYTVSTAQFVNNDRGRTVVHNAGSTGTLLWFDASINEAWIRPTNCTSTHSWAQGGTNQITVTGGTGDVTQSSAPANGERLWSNIYSIGTIEDQTNLIVYQNFSQVTSFWATGHINRLFLVNDGFASGLIDSGFLTVFARQYGKLYDHFTADASGGGINPIPLATNDDINNTTGYRTMTVAGVTGTFTVGNYVFRSTGGLTWSTTDTKGVITTVSGSDISYYLVGDYTDFVAGADDVQEYNPATGANGDASATSITSVANTTNGPTDTVPASITIVFGGTSQDLSNGNGSRPYSVIINCQGATLTRVYERFKYLTRNGQITDIDTGANQSIIGQQYTATGDLYIPYDTGSIDNPFSEVGGETITATSFTSVLTSKHDRGTNEGFIVVRNTRGTTPIDNATLTGVTSGNTALVDTNAAADPVTVISPIKTAPFGTFAGGTFFGTRGVWIYNMAGADANNYTLIDAEGVAQDPPASVAIAVNSVVSGDRVSVFRATDTNGTIDKSYMVSHATSNSASSTTFTTASTIPLDTPSTGYLRIVDRDGSGNILSEERIAFTSWSGSAFTLSSAHSGSYDSNDTAYAPYIDDTASGTSISTSVSYVADRNITTRVRKKGIQPFTVNTTQLTSSGYTATAVRVTDGIVNLP